MFQTISIIQMSLNSNTEINNSIQTLKSGNLILFPTDTVWSIGCDATNVDAVNKIQKLKQYQENDPLVCLVANDRMLKKYVKKIPDVALNIIEVTNKPTTIIYDDAQNLAQNLIAEDGTIAIRIPDDDFCFQLCRKLNGAVVSTSANIIGYPTPNSFKEIQPAILNNVDYVVNLQREKICNKTTSIIKISNGGIVKIIRE